MGKMARVIRRHEFPDLREARRDSTTTPIRPLHFAAMREWLGLTAEEQRRVENLEQARDATVQALVRFGDHCSARDLATLRMAYFRPMGLGKVYYPEVWAALAPETARKAKALHYRSEGLDCITWPASLRDEFGVTDDMSTPAWKALGAGQTVNNGFLHSAPKSRDEVLKASDAATLAALPEHLRKRWHEAIRLEVEPPKELWQAYLKFVNNATPREPYPPAAGK